MKEPAYKGKEPFKSKKKLWNDPSEWVIFENTQEPIIEESVFLIVQKIRQGRRRPTKMGDMGMFSGLLYCADCGGKMYLCRTNYFKPEQEYYICSTYRKDRTLCTTHSIRRVVLEEIVLRNLREAIQYVTQYEDDFVQRAADQSLRERDKELAQKKDTLTQSQKRIAELDVIIKRLYEDNISGKLSDERFIKLSRDYELEQTNLTNLCFSAEKPRRLQQSTGLLPRAAFQILVLSQNIKHPSKDGCFIFWKR
ncbi:MAG: recombinase zinc beta ribbon domain-containing protein [Oscillospiraceae bacterium]